MSIVLSDCSIIDSGSEALEEFMEKMNPDIPETAATAGVPSLDASAVDRTGVAFAGWDWHTEL